VDIDISFVTGPHNDNQPFSRRLAGQPVAHAYFPNPGDHAIYHHLRGDIHFDSTRGWTVNSEDGINFFQIATHEIGHSLGLEHSAAPLAIMHAIPPVKYDPAFALHYDDIKGIQNLYGARIHSRMGKSGSLQLEVPLIESEEPRLVNPPLEPPGIVVMYYFQPLKYLWNCHQLASSDQQSSLHCYEQVTHFLLAQHRQHFHS